MLYHVSHEIYSDMYRIVKIYPISKQPTNRMEDSTAWNVAELDSFL